MTIYTLPRFTRYIGIDYSGAETPTSSLKGLRVYEAHGDAMPEEVPPPPSPKKYWTRKGIAHWLRDVLTERTPTLVGIDHGFSFPAAYYAKHGLPHDWDTFLVDFQLHWPLDHDHMYVDFVRDGDFGTGAMRTGDPHWRRLTEVRAGSAKSVFHFDVQGAVAKSTHSGLPWLFFLRTALGKDVHFWPFDGWDIPAGRSAIVEVYPKLWSYMYHNADRTTDQHDAYSVARRLQEGDRQGLLADWLDPTLNESQRAQAEIEGWILGVG